MLNIDALLLIFKYLDAEDLESVANVCRLWQEAALVERKRRNSKTPLSYSDDYLQEEDYFPIALVRAQLDKLGIQPILGIFCTREYPPVEFQAENAAAPCNVISPHGDTVVIGAHGFCINDTGYAGGNEKIISLFIPDISHLAIKTIIYETGSRSHEELINALGDPNDHTKTRCILLFGQLEDSETLRNTLNELSDKGYTESNTCLLGGTVQTIHACNPKSGNFETHSNDCIKLVDSVAVTIVGTNMKAWCIYCKDFPRTYMICDFPIPPDEHGNIRMPKRVYLPEELEGLKRKIHLKKYSYGIIFTDRYRTYTYDEIETETIERIFPEIPFVGYFGHQGIRFDDGRYNLSEDTFYTTVLILTYD